MSDDIIIEDDPEDFPPLSDEDVAELQRRMDDAEDPTRYMIKSDLGYSGSFILWYNVTDDTWCSDQISGTMFKRLKHAEAVFDQMDRSFVTVEAVLIDLVEASEDDEYKE